MNSEMITTPLCKVRVYEAGSGPDLVFLHGAGGLLENDPFIEALSREYHVFAPILPGYQDSEGEENLNDMLSVTLHTLDVIENLGITDPLLVGHSMGGMIAAEMAATAPNDISKLVLISPAGIWKDENPLPDLFATLPFELPGLLFKREDLGNKLLASGMDFNDPEFLIEFLVGNAKRLGMAGKLLFPIPDRGLRKRLYRIKCPTILIWGDADRMIPPDYADEFLDRISNATLKIVEDAGHMVMYEDSSAVIKAINEIQG